MKENKEFQIKFRLTASLKEEIVNYCSAQDITLSQFMRQAVREYLGGKTK